MSSRGLTITKEETGAAGVRYMSVQGQITVRQALPLEWIYTYKMSTSWKKAAGHMRGHFKNANHM